MLHTIFNNESFHQALFDIDISVACNIKKTVVHIARPSYIRPITHAHLLG